MTFSFKPNSFLTALVSLAPLTMGGCVGMDAMAAGAMGDMAASAAGIPQMEAFLPNKFDVPPTQPMSIDGTYKISTLGKRITIDRGRAYAVDGWTHAMTLKIRPDMVTMRNITQIDADSFSGDDLPMLAKASLELQPDGSIDTVLSGMVPYKYKLVPVQSVDAGSAQPYPVAPTPAPVGGSDQSPPTTCDLVDVDPETGSLICLD